MARGIVTFFTPDKGWGAVAVDELPDGEDVWVHFSVIQGDGYLAFEPGDIVELDYEPARQDGFRWRATRARRVGSGPAPTLRRRDDGSIEVRPAG